MLRFTNALGIISSVPAESALIGRQAEDKRDLAPGIWTGTLSGHMVIHITSGVGVVNAAWAATTLIERYGIENVINIGIAGAFPKSGLNIGDVVAATEEVYADTGMLLTDGAHDMKDMGIELLKKGRKKHFNSFPMDTQLLKKAQSHVTAKGKFLTVSQATGTDKRARELFDRHKALAENMEGAAVAHTAMRYGISALELRGISNMVGKRDTSKWKIKPAATNCQMALINFLKEL